MPINSALAGRLAPARDPVAQYLRYCDVEKGLQPTTIEQYRDALTKFVGSMRRPFDVLTVGEPEIRNYVFAEYAKRAGPRSQAKLVRMLREFFKFLQIDGLRRDTPMARVDAPKWEKPLLMPPSQAEMAQLLQSISGQSAEQIRDRAMFELGYASGLRVSEITTARLGDLDLDGGKLIVYGKGRKERMAPFGIPATTALRLYLEKSRPRYAKADSPEVIFLDRQGTMLSRQAVWQALQRAHRRAAIAGMAHVRTHDLRSAMGTHMLERKADLRTIQEILGHVEITSTQFYTKLTVDHIREAAARHPRWRKHLLQWQLFQAAAPLPLPGQAMCWQCREPVCARSKTLCAKHLQLASEAAKRHRDKKRRR